MTLRLNNLRVEAANPRQLAQFWIRALNWHLVHGTKDAVLIAPSSHRPLPPECLAVLFRRRDGDGSERSTSERSKLLFDLAPSDRNKEITRLLELGATVVDADAGDERWTLMADPEGNEFCVIHPPGQLPKSRRT